jgi:Fic family protein
LEWIHPFGDGNGRTGRLLEFYILLRAGMPFYTSHILSNHYNLTRSSYYLYLHKATEQRDLGVFLAYAIQGLYDGLQLALQTVVESIQKITWTQHIYTHLKASANRKPRLLALLNELGNHLNKAHTPAELELLSPLVARAYSKSHKSILSGDLKLLCEQSFLVHEGPKYRVNAELFLANYLP